MVEYVRRTVALGVISAALASCGPDEASGPSAGVPEYTASEFVRIGSIDDPVYSLTRIDYVIALPDGGVLSTHSREGLIRRFDETGRILYAVGGLGDGPGEFDFVGAPSLVDDTIAVVDLGTGLVSYFDLESGAHSRTVRVSFSPNSFNGQPLEAKVVLDGGDFVAGQVIPSYLVASGEISTYDFVLTDSDGGLTDTLPAIPMGNSQWSISFPTGGGAYSRQAFADNTIWRVGRDGSFYLLEREVVPSESPTIRVSRVATSGDTVWATEIPYSPQPISEADVDSIIETLTPEAPAFGRSRADYSTRWRESMYRPPHRPGASNLILATDERLWVGGASGKPQTTWWVLSSEGELLFTVDLPSSVSIRAAQGQRVWGVENDDFDVPYLVGLEVTPTGGGIPN